MVYQIECFAEICAVHYQFRHKVSLYPQLEILGFLTDAVFPWWTHAPLYTKMDNLPANEPRVLNLQRVHAILTGRLISSIFPRPSPQISTIAAAPESIHCLSWLMEAREGLHKGSVGIVANTFRIFDWIPSRPLHFFRFNNHYLFHVLKIRSQLSELGRSKLVVFRHCDIGPSGMHLLSISCRRLSYYCLLIPHLRPLKWALLQHFQMSSLIAHNGITFYGPFSRTTQKSAQMFFHCSFQLYRLKFPFSVMTLFLFDLLGSVWHTPPIFIF